MIEDLEIEEYRRAQQIIVNSEPIPKGVQTWDTEQLKEEFRIIGFAAPYVAVQRKSDLVMGSLMFKHSPRVYFNFKPLVQHVAKS